MNRFIMILIVFAVLCMPAFGQTTAIFDSWNGGSVDNNPTSSASFTISEPHLITYIDTYHFNSGQGVSAGGTISLKRDDGEIFGPWTVTAESGSGAAKAWWKCLPYVVIPAGTYTIIDSEPETWSMNTESNGCGFSKVEGHPEYSVSVSEPDRIENVAQEEAADVSLDSGKETEAALTSDVALGNKENKLRPSDYTNFTPTQKEFLQAIKDDLIKIGSSKVAANLSKYIDEKRALIYYDKPDFSASANSPLGYLSPTSSNTLIINQYAVDNWNQYKKYGTKQEKWLQTVSQSIRDMSFIMIHEDVHMGQHAPQQKPIDEDPAYETQIREERRVIDEDMQKIREIQGRGANLPGDQDRLNELIKDLKISKNVYQETINNLQQVIVEGNKVTPEKFKTAQADMIRLIEEADDLIKNDAIGWYNKGTALYNQLNYADAIKAYEEAIRLDPNYAKAWLGKGKALYNQGWVLKYQGEDDQGKFDEAVKAYDEAIKLDPNYTEAWKSKGTVLSDQGNYADAIKAYDEAIRADPKDARAWHNKGYVLNAIGDTTGAENAYAKADELGYTG